MPRGEQGARLCALVTDLSSITCGVPAITLVRSQGWNLRAVYADLHALEEAGLPFPQGDGARRKLVDGLQDQLPFPPSTGKPPILDIGTKLVGRRDPGGVRDESRPYADVDHRQRLSVKMRVRSNDFSRSRSYACFPTRSSLTSCSPRRVGER